MGRFYTMLSAPQISLVYSQSVSQKRLCRYFNESSCSHEGHHGLYKHNCSFCSKQGRTDNHSESKCNFKHKKQETVNLVNSYICVQPSGRVRYFLEQVNPKQTFNCKTVSNIYEYRQALLNSHDYLT